MYQKPENSSLYGDFIYNDTIKPEIEYEPYHNGTEVVTPVVPLPGSVILCENASDGLNENR